MTTQLMFRHLVTYNSWIYLSGIFSFNRADNTIHTIFGEFNRNITIRGYISQWLYIKVDNSHNIYRYIKTIKEYRKV